MTSNIYFTFRLSLYTNNFLTKKSGIMCLSEVKAFIGVTNGYCREYKQRLWILTVYKGKARSGTIFQLRNIVEGMWRPLSVSCVPYCHTVTQR